MPVDLVLRLRGVELAAAEGASGKGAFSRGLLLEGRLLPLQGCLEIRCRVCVVFRCVV